MMICYILDGILFVYAIILTVLYCRLKKQENDEAVYTGLTPHAASTYETIHVQKKGKF